MCKCRKFENFAQTTMFNAEKKTILSKQQKLNAENNFTLNAKMPGGKI